MVPTLSLALCFVAIVALCLSGCTIGRYYYGVPIQGDPAQIHEGTTSRADVLRLCGPPFQIVHQTNGDAFVYKYEQQNTSTLQLRDPITGTTWFTYTRQFDRRDALVVFFDFTGVVRGVAMDRDVDDMPAL